MKRVVVTGGAGFIGSALVRGLLADGVEHIVVIDNLATGKKDNLIEVLDKIDYHEADIRDYRTLERLFVDADTVFHHAAIPGVPRSVQEPELTHDVNVNGALNALLAAQKQGVRRVIYAGSASAYGDTEVMPKNESLQPQPGSPYAVQKLAGEYYAKTFFDHYGLETVSLRYFNVFGPRQDPTSTYSGVIAAFCKAILRREPATIYGDGEQTRDFVYIDNIVDLNLRAARSEEACGSVYNGGTGGRVTITETWELLQRIEGVRLAVTYGPPRQGDVRNSQADVSAAKRDLGYVPTVGLEEGLRRTLAWYRDDRSAVQTCQTIG